MRKYLIRLAIISTLLIVVLSLLLVARRAVILNHSFRLPEQVHILFLGASHINHGIDDSLILGSINWSRGSERYMYTYIKIQRLLDVNPQVDTVFLELAPTDLFEDTDYKYHDLNEQSGYVRLYWPFFTTEQWKVFVSEPFQVLGLVVESLGDIGDLKQNKWWVHMGNYNKVTTEMNPAEVKPLMVALNGDGHKVNYDYLRRIISLCREKKVQLYFLESPTYHPEYHYDQAYFYDAYNKYFSDVEFLDYSSWPVTADERKDEDHLNHKGAQRFTKEIKERFGF